MDDPLNIEIAPRDAVKVRRSNTFLLDLGCRQRPVWYHDVLSLISDGPWRSLPVLGVSLSPYNNDRAEKGSSWFVDNSRSSSLHVLRFAHSSTTSSPRTAQCVHLNDKRQQSHILPFSPLMERQCAISVMPNSIRYEDWA